MTDPTTSLPSLADRVRSIDAGGAVVGVHFLKNTPVFVLGEEHLLFADDSGDRRVTVHKGAILASAADADRIVTGGETNYVLATVGLYVSIFNLFTSLLSLFGYGWMDRRFRFNPDGSLDAASRRCLH